MVLETGLSESESVLARSRRVDDGSTCLETGVKALSLKMLLGDYEEVGLRNARGNTGFMKSGFKGI